MMNNVIEEGHIRIVRSIAGYYAQYGTPFDDLVQEGMIGLLEAWKRYDPEKGSKFTTYATFWIKKRMLQFVNKERLFQKNTTPLNENTLEDTTEQHQTIVPSDTEEASRSEKVQLPEEMPVLEQTVIRSMFEENRTLSEISRLLGLRREKVRQIKAKALRRLRFMKSSAEL